MSGGPLAALLGAVVVLLGAVGMLLGAVGVLLGAVTALVGSLGGVGRWIVAVGRRLAATAGLAWRQVRGRPGRSLAAAGGVALAVLAVTLLVATGAGVVETGERQFEAADRDLWVTAGDARLSPTGGGGIHTGITGAPALAAELEDHEAVSTAVPIAVESIYVKTAEGDYETVVAVGVPGTGGDAVSIDEGESFSDPASHHADGEYDGPMTHEAIVDAGFANRFEAGPGESVNLGGTTSAADEHAFDVVGTSPTFAEFLGTETVVLPLAELYRITGTVETEPATFVVVTLEDGADEGAVAAELDAEHEDLAVRTDAEQFEAILADRTAVIAAGVALIVVGVLAGLAMTANLLGLAVHQQRRAIAALLAQGGSRGTVVLTLGWQGVLIGLAGAAMGVGLAIPGAWLLERATSRLVGFEGLLAMEPWILALGVGIAVAVGTLGAAYAGWRVARLDPLGALE